MRLGNVAGEVDQAYHYDYVIIHQDWDDVPDALEIAVEEVYAIICAAPGQRIQETRDFLNSISPLSLNAGK